MTEQQMYIAGEWVNSSDNNFSDAIINPATGEVIAKIPKATIQDVERCHCGFEVNFPTILLGKILTSTTR